MMSSAVKLPATKTPAQTMIPHPRFSTHCQPLITGHWIKSAYLTHLIENRGIESLISVFELLSYGGGGGRVIYREVVVLVGREMVDVDDCGGRLLL